MARVAFCLLIGATCWSEAEPSSAPTATRAGNGAPWRALLALEDDIRAVLSMADTVIDLDFWATGRRFDTVAAARRQSATDPTSASPVE